MVWFMSRYGKNAMSRQTWHLIERWKEGKCLISVSDNALHLFFPLLQRKWLLKEISSRHFYCSHVLLLLLLLLVIIKTDLHFIMKSRPLSLMLSKRGTGRTSRMDFYFNRELTQDEIAFCLSALDNFHVSVRHPRKRLRHLQLYQRGR